MLALKQGLSHKAQFEARSEKNEKVEEQIREVSSTTRQPHDHLTLMAMTFKWLRALKSLVFRNVASSFIWTNSSGENNYTSLKIYI